MGGKAVDAKLYEHFEATERLTLMLEAMARDDDVEADRLRDTCPRKTYTTNDLAFQDRLNMSFSAMAVVCIDLRFLMGKLHTLHWAMRSVAEFGAMNHITAQLAFVDGTRCAQGFNQMDFFRTRPKLPSSDNAVGVDADEGDAGEPVVEQGQEEDFNGVKEVDEGHPPTAEQVERGRRMDAVEQRAEYGTDCVMLILMHAANDVAGDLVNTWEAFGRFCRTRVGIEPTTLLQAWGPAIADNLEATIKRFKHVKVDPVKVAEYEGLICKGWDRRFREMEPLYRIGTIPITGP